LPNLEYPPEGIFPFKECFSKILRLLLF